MFLWLLCTWMIVIGPHTVQSYIAANETTLRGDLAIGYDSAVRPNSTVDVEIALQMTSIKSLDLKTQSLSFSGWWALTWTDSRLTWTPSSYDDIGLITFYEDDIWTPSLVVSNSMTDVSAIDAETIPMRVTQNGTVEWNLPGILVTQCDVDTKYFPFDKQECTIEVTSFGYSLSEINLTTGGLILDYGITTGDWDIVVTSSSRTFYARNGIIYGQIFFNVTLERKIDLYWLNVLLLVFLNGILSIFPFVVPFESGEKVGFSMTVLLTLVVLMTLLKGEVPGANDSSLLEIYVSFVLFVSCLSVVVAIINLAIYHRKESHPVSQWAIHLCISYRRICALWRCRKVSVVETDTTMEQRNPIGQATEEAKNEQRALHDKVTWKEVAAALDLFFLLCYGMEIIVISMFFGWLSY